MKNKKLVNKILVTSTWDNNYTLLTFFINFYNLYWEKPYFLFICGYKENEKKEVLDQFVEFKKIKFKRKLQYFKYSDKFAKKLRLYNSDRYYLITYKTNKNKKAFDWDRLRKNLFNLIFKKRLFKHFDYYLNTDNDDFYYVKNLEDYLTNYENNPEEYDYFHSLEFLPVEKFSKESKFHFISYPYFYIQKGRNGKLSKINKHTYCRKLNLNHKFKNEIHVELNKDRKQNCEHFDNSFSVLNDIDRACFAIGCLDLDYLMKNKYFVEATSPGEAEIFKYNHDEIKKIFKDSYLLSKDEKKGFKIFDLKKLIDLFDNK